jgi:hypothetical protein
MRVVHVFFLKLYFLFNGVRSFMDDESPDSIEQLKSVFKATFFLSIIVTLDLLVVSSLFFVFKWLSLGSILFLFIFTFLSFYFTFKK